MYNFYYVHTVNNETFKGENFKFEGFQGFLINHKVSLLISIRESWFCNREVFPTL